jgi:hypothetical protein
LAVIATSENWSVASADRLSSAVAR